MGEYFQGRAFIAAFVAIWLVYFAVLGSLGFSSQYPELGRALSYQLFFVVLLAVAPAFAPLPSLKSRPPKPDYLLATIVTGLTASAVAILCLWIDKIELGVNYSGGVCLAREQMTSLGSMRAGVRSPYSFIGNLFGVAFFVPVAAVLTQKVTRRIFWATMLISFFLLMVLSTIAASRSTIMLFAAFAIGMLCCRLAINRPIPRITAVDVCGCIAIAGIAAFFILLMFDCRASASHMTATQYRDSFLSYLGASSGNQSDVVMSVPVGGVAIAFAKARALVNLSALYFVHSAFTFSGILSAPADSGRILFVYPLQLLEKVGIGKAPDAEWMFSGRFASLPGALWHDFGFFGMCFGAFVLGVAAWGGLAAVRLYPNSLVLIGIASALFAVAILSPLHFAVEFAHFPFVCFGFLAIPVLAYAAVSLTEFARRKA